MESKNKGVVEKIRQDEEIRKYCKDRNLWVIALGVLLLSYLIPELINTFSDNLGNIDKISIILWIAADLLILVETVINLIKLKKQK